MGFHICVHPTAGGSFSDATLLRGNDFIRCLWWQFWSPWPISIFLSLTGRNWHTERLNCQSHNRTFHGCPCCRLLGLPGFAIYPSDLNAIPASIVYWGSWPALVDFFKVTEKELSHVAKKIGTSSKGFFPCYCFYLYFNEEVCQRSVSRILSDGAQNIERSLEVFTWTLISELKILVDRWPFIKYSLHTW